MTNICSLCKTRLMYKPYYWNEYKDGDSTKIICSCCAYDIHINKVPYEELKAKYMKAREENKK